MNNSFYIAIPLLGLLAIIQTSVLPRFPIAGVAPQLLFLVALGWGLQRGLKEGLIWAFIAGIWVDLFSIAPLGVSSVAFMAGVGTAIVVQQILPPRNLLSAILLAALGTLIYLAVYVLALRIFGHSISLSGVLEILPLFLLHVILIVPVYLLFKSILRALQPAPIRL